MGDLPATSGADHGWLAKVLAGDPVACAVSDLARSFTTDEWDAFARFVERMKVGMPLADVLAAPWQECSQAPA